MSDGPGSGTGAGPAIRSGFVGLAGRPNVGKSTLVNAIVGAKVAIISERPQTTRRALRGIATAPGGEWQMVLVDLPGVQRPRDSLTERMQRRVERELGEADAALLVLNGEQGVGPGDRFIADTLLGAGAGAEVGDGAGGAAGTATGGGAAPVVCAVNKCDSLDRAQTLAVLSQAAELSSVDAVFPISARTGAGLRELTEHLSALLPEGPLMYPPEERSDAAGETHLAELIREQVLRRTREEVPHAVEVAIQDLELRDDGIFEVRAQIWTETESQKAILIGKGGRMVRDVGTAARAELERELGGKVYLDLRVRVRERWRRDDDLLDRLGIE